MTFLLATLLVQEVTEAKVRELARQLDADDAGERDEAVRRLLELGPAAAVHLKPLLESASGEAAGRIRSILESLDREERLARRLPNVMRITMPRGTHSVADVLAEMRRQSGYTISVYDLELTKRIEFGGEPVPLLQAIDDLCRAMGQGAPMYPSTQIGQEGRRHFFDEEATPSSAITIEGGRPFPVAVAYGGPFRAAVADVVITERRSFAGTTRQISLAVSTQSQPGTAAMYVGAWRVEEAVDDKGVSLKREDAAASGRSRTPEPEIGDDPGSVWFVGGRSGGAEYYSVSGLSINPPSIDARRITSLKIGRRLAFPMDEVSRTVKVGEIEEGTSLRFGETAVQIQKFKAESGRFELEYTLSGSIRGNPTIVLLDAAGKPISCHGYGSGGDGERMSCDWNFNEGVVVDAIRTTAHVGHRAIDVTFEFKDIPLPEGR
jgi:hypothetical protein